VGTIVKYLLGIHRVIECIPSEQSCKPRLRCRTNTRIIMERFYTGDVGRPTIPSWRCGVSRSRIANARYVRSVLPQIDSLRGGQREAARCAMTSRALASLCDPTHSTTAMLHSLRRHTTRNMKLDPGVVKLLGLDPEHTKVSSAGGGGCSSASTSRISAKLSDGTDRAFFLKTGSGDDAKVMFEGNLGCVSWLRVILTS
jgi:hypothetical protein